MALSTTLSFAQGLGPLALAPMFGDLIESFHSDLGSVVKFTGNCILVLGFSNFIWYVLIFQEGLLASRLIRSQGSIVANHWQTSCGNLVMSDLSSFYDLAS